MTTSRDAAKQHWRRRRYVREGGWFRSRPFTSQAASPVPPSVYLCAWPWFVLISSGCSVLGFVIVQLRPRPPPPDTSAGYLTATSHSRSSHTLPAVASPPARPPPLGLVRAASLAVLRDAATPFAVPSAAALQPPPPTLDVPTHPAAAGGNDARIQIPPRGREAASRSLRPHAFAFPTTMPAAASALHATRQTRLAGAWPTAPDSWLTAAALPPHATTTHIPAWVPHTPDGAARRTAAYSAPQVFDSTTTSLADMLHAQAALYAEAPAAPAPATTGGVEAPGWRLLPASVDGVGGNEQPVPGKVLAPWSPPGAGGTIHNRGASWYGQRALAPVEGGTLQLTAPASQGNAARQALFMAHVAARAPTRRAPAKVWGT